MYFGEGLCCVRERGGGIEGGIVTYLVLRRGGVLMILVGALVPFSRGSTKKKKDFTVQVIVAESLGALGL